MNPVTFIMLSLLFDSHYLLSAKHVGSKTLHQQNPAVLNWRCWLTQVDLCNGRKMVVVVVVWFPLKPVVSIEPSWIRMNHFSQSQITVKRIYHGSVMQWCPAFIHFDFGCFSRIVPSLRWNPRSVIFMPLSIQKMGWGWWHYVYFPVFSRLCICAWQRHSSTFQFQFQFEPLSLTSTFTLLWWHCVYAFDNAAYYFSWEFDSDNWFVLGRWIITLHLS